MLSFLPPPLRGVLACLMLGVGTVVLSMMLWLLALVKLVLGTPAARRRLDPVLNAVASAWISWNGLTERLTQRTRWDVQGVESLDLHRWYMVTCNHQSWADIFVLQRVLNRRIPLLKFFLKHELLYVPVIGLAWWALDFPFLRRHGKEALQKNPALLEQDLAAARRACEKFALVPTSVMTFPEGTRFTAAKHQGQRSPYRHLLKPKSGGLAASLATMGSRFSSLLDVTIVYPDGVPTFWDFACGRCPRITVRVREVEIPADFLQSTADAGTASRTRVHRWVDQLWQEKDREIERLQAARPPAP